ncbi:MAG: HAMP domain-containing histidine kinase [Acidobacteria bacterium]|nr:HAMP domain-containing histidine kinase [Acidobacteriota bacterium]
MKRVSHSLVFVVVMIALLAVLAVLQYVWLGQVSDGERERLKARLESDTRRFADDFNREMQSAYFNFQLPINIWESNDWSEFNDRYDFWRGRSAYPNLIRSFSFVDLKRDSILVYDSASKSFVPGTLPENVAGVRTMLKQSGEVPAVASEVPALLMPVYDVHESIKKIIVRSSDSPPEPIKPQMPDRKGFLVIELDKSVVKDGIVADLTKKYFSESDGANYDLAIVDAQNRPVFDTPVLAGSDSTAKLLDLQMDNFVFYQNRDTLPRTGVTRSVVFSATTQKIETKSAKTNSNSNIDLHILTDDIKPRIDIRESKPRDGGEAAWVLNVQHSSGSIENFITSTRRRNLGVSFGILSLIGASILIIFLSAQRARTLAQRQVDFVSSVSHEFRTPLAVIYSASENLADGVAREPGQITRYGELIKNEGRKLSAMVEQILEFAGARSGKRRYDFEELNLDDLIDDAIDESRPLIDREKFTIERERCGSAIVSADRAALTGAFQNLISNSVKYSNGSKWMRIGCVRHDGKVSIEFEDEGIGIAPVDLKQIFEPFFRARSVVDEQIHGNGLGLSLVKETVEAHRGSIEVESEVGKGSRFVIQLPTV